MSTVTGTVADVVHKHEGTLLEFIGDEVLSVFNTPKTQKNHVYLGVSTAVHIHQAMQKLTYRTLKSDKEIAIQCRCGVHTGPIFAGNIGSPQRMKYGLLGDGINLTARLKGLNSRYRSRTLVSANVFNDLSTMKGHHRHILLRPVDLVAVKGKKEPTVVYESLLPGHHYHKIKHASLRHAEGFKLYQHRMFEEARTAFEEVGNSMETLGGIDWPSRMLADRCEAYIEAPPPEDWDGVERMTAKSFDNQHKGGGHAAGGGAAPVGAEGGEDLGDEQRKERGPTVTFDDRLDDMEVSEERCAEEEGLGEQEEAGGGVGADGAWCDGDTWERAPEGQSSL